MKCWHKSGNFSARETDCVSSTSGANTNRPRKFGIQQLQFLEKQAKTNMGALCMNLSDNPLAVC